jgi:asparagine synthase (glutamine-hydrolysing)
MMWGTACLDRIIGAFAFAVRNLTTKELFLARDHSGQRPIYYRKGEGFFAFSTSVRALLKCAGISPELDP